MSKVVVVGSYVEDLTFWNESLPLVGETRISYGFQTGQGGKGFNQAVACSRQGIETLFVGAIGTKDGQVDSFGEEVQRFAQQEKNLETSFSIDSDHPTGAASIAVDKEGHNQISVYLGANAYLPPSHIKEVGKKITNADILLCQLESNLDSTRDALQMAREKGVYTLLNPAPINAGFEPEMLSSVDVITPNESEFLFLLEKLGIDTKYTPENLTHYANYTPVELARVCAKIPVETTIITLGGEGSFMADSAQSSYVPAKSVETIDTTGAGDAFSGGLAAGLVKYNHNILKAMEYATAVAGLSTTKKGTSPSMPYENDIIPLLKN